jgi:hypothetical protein
MTGNPIKKRLLINIAMIAGVAVLAVVVQLTPDQGGEKRLYDKFDADSIAQLRIEQSGNPPIVISKIDDHWELIEPVNVPASPFRINSVLNIAQAAGYADYAISDIDTSELGLDTSPLTLYLDEHKIRFGSKDPIDERRYTQLDERVYLLDDYYLPLLTQPLVSFIDTHILPEYLNIISYQLPEFNISQTETGGWQIEPPIIELNADASQQWVDRWRRQRASEVSYPLDIKQENAIQIALRLADGNSIPLEAIQTEEWSGFYWPAKKIGYKISEGALGLLLSKPEKEIEDVNSAVLSAGQDQE